MITYSTIFPSLWAIMPELYLLLSVVVMLLFGLFFRGCTASFLARLSACVLLGALVLHHVLVPTLPQDFYCFNGFIRQSPLITVLKTMILVASAAVLYLYGSMAKTRAMDRFEIPLLILLSTFGMLIMVASADFLSFYLGLEMQSLALYVLASVDRDNSKSTEAGLKYFMLGALASGFILYGISLLYGYGTSTEFGVLAASFQQVATPPLGITIGMICVLSGLLFKIGAVPFHMWVPDVYQGSPTIITCFFATAPKLAALGILLRILSEVFGIHPFQWQQILFLVASLTLLWGAFGACVQRNIKRLLAYSSIGHVGFILLGVIVGTKEGMLATLFYMAIYAVMSLGIFACLLRIERNGRTAEEWGDLSGLLHTHPLEAILLITLLFSMAGIPPLAGFFVKLKIYTVVLDAGLWQLVVVALVASIVSTYYYLKIIKQIVCDPPAESVGRQGQMGLLLCGGFAACINLGYILIPSAPLTALNAMLTLS